MPNWVENELYVNGNPKEVGRFIRMAKGKGTEKSILDFNNFIPYPADLALLDNFANEWDEAFHKIKNKREEKKYLTEKPRPKDGYNSGGYEWCIKNWGTKWNACNVIVNSDETYEKKERMFQLLFNTAWSSPVPVVRKMSEIFPSLNFRLLYFEGGMGFSGCFECCGGKTTLDDIVRYYGHRGG